MAARNLVLAEQMKMDIALVCNGCYKSIWEVNHKLKHNKDLRDAVNEVLKEVDMEYKGTINVYHTAELLYNDKFIGVDKVRDSVTNPLTGARIAVHYGCHLTKPHKDREFEKEVMLNTEHPIWMEELVAALGATPVEYRNKMQCCGAGGGVRGYDIVHSLDITNEKLINLKGREGGRTHGYLPVLSAPVRPRPDRDPGEVRRLPTDCPVLHFAELLGLAQGMSPQDLGLDLHGISCEPFLQKVL